MKKVILIIIALAICAIQRDRTLDCCAPWNNNIYQFMPKVKSFCAFNYGWNWFQSKDGPGKTMKSRILPNILSSIFTKDLCYTDIKGYGFYRNKLAIRIAWWNAVWMFLTLLVVILAYDSLLWVFGLGLGCLWAYMPLAMYNIYSYDGPILFFWMLMVIFATRGKWRKYFLPTMLVAMLCKETALVCCLVPLMWTDLPMKQRIKKILIFAASGILLKIAVDICVQNPIPFFSMVTSAGPTHPQSIIENFHKLTAFTFDTPWLACAGMVLGLMLLPNSPLILVWKLIAVVFTIGIMFCGISTEYRIFQELIPVFLFCYNEGILKYEKH